MEYSRPVRDGALPQFPGEEFLAHEGTKFMDLAKPILAKMKLLAVANGQMPAAAAMIKDFDLTKLPSLPHTHRDYTRREETRIKYQSQNEANNEKRNLITY